MANRETHYDAPWAENLRHRSDPNRVSDRPDRNQAAIEAPRLESRPPTPPGATIESRSSDEAQQAADAAAGEPSYYDV